jgi:anti-sigma regulatory factor (Ser/Thr protein kinase)
MVKISDEGGGFDPQRLFSQDSRLLQEERESVGKRGGGFGLAIVREKMDRVTFNGKGNVVMMTKYFKGRE